MSDPSPAFSPKAVEGVPTEQIEEACKIADRVHVKLVRRNDRGQFAYIEKVIMDLKDVLDIESYARKNFGGGRYCVYTYHLDYPAKKVVPPFTFTIEGLSHPINREVHHNIIQGYTPDGRAIVLTSYGPVAMPAEQAHAIQRQDIKMLGNATNWQPQPLPLDLQLQMRQYEMANYMARHFPGGVVPGQMLQQPQIDATATTGVQNADGSDGSESKESDSKETSPTKASGSQSAGGPPVNPFGNFGNGMSPAVQFAHGFGPAVPVAPAPGASMASDQALANQIRMMQAESERQKAEHQAVLARLEEQNKLREVEIDRLRADADKKERQAAEERHRLEMKAMQDRFELTVAALKDKPTQPAVSDLERYQGIAAILGAAAPVLAAMVSSGKETSAAALQTQQQQMQAIMQMFAATSNKKDDGMADTIKALAPVLGPVLVQMLANKSPEAQANLVQSVSENSMQNMAMMAQFIQQMAAMQGDGAPPWLPIVENIIKGGMEAFAGMAASKQQNTRIFPAPRAQLPAGPAVHPQASAVQPSGGSVAPPSSIYSTMEESSIVTPAPSDSTVVEAAADGVVEPQAAVDDGVKPAPAMMTRLVMTRVPEDFRRPEWERIIHALHAQDDVQYVAQMITGMLAHLQSFDMLPQGLTTVMDDPRNTLGVIIQEFPVWGYAPEYCQQIVEAVALLIEADLAAAKEVDESNGLGHAPMDVVQDVSHVELAPA